MAGLLFFFSLLLQNSWVQSKGNKNQNDDILIIGLNDRLIAYLINQYVEGGGDL